MAKNHYTLLIVPKTKRSVRKFTASSTHLKVLFIACLAALSSLSFFLYDYARTKNDEFQLRSLKVLTESQKEQIGFLASRVKDFEKKMEDLRQLDQKIRTIANLDGKKPANLMLGIGGIPAEDNANPSIDRINKNLDRLLKAASSQENSFAELLEYLKKRESILAATPSIWPVKGWVTSEFGYRTSPYGSREEFHRGIDIAARLGKEIMVPADGIVTEVVDRADMGRYVVVDHMKGMKTGYAHLLRSTVSPGKSVKRGEVIGYVGNSGRSTGSHLHYSVYLNGIPVNPRKYLP
jgi:murein DD-endopeptidase MepM/ murein hydrolase activator NlpD